MSAVPAVPAAAPGLLVAVVAALYETGRILDVDWELETFDVLPSDDAGDPLLGVVLHHARAVAFYRVYPTYVPPAVRPAVMEHVTRQNTMLGTSAFELDLDTGTLSLRTGLALPDVELDLPVLAAILSRMIAEVDAVHARTRTEIEALIAQASDAAASTARADGTPSDDADQPTSEDHA